MSDFDDEFAAGPRAELLERNGDPAVWVTDAGQRVDVTVIVAAESEEEVAAEGGRKVIRRKTLLLSKDPTGGRAAISRMETVRLGCLVYSVSDVPKRTGSLWRVEVELHEWIERSHGTRRVRGV